MYFISISKNNPTPNALLETQQKSSMINILY